MPSDCLKIIESKSKVCQSRAKEVVAKVNSSSYTPAISSDVAELKDMRFTAKETPVSDLRWLQIKFDLSDSLPSGTPGNTITNPKEDLKDITTRSSVAYQGPIILVLSKVVKQGTKVTKDQVQTPSSQSTAPVQPPVAQSKTLVPEPIVAPVSAPMPNLKSSIPYPSRRDNERRRDPTPSDDPIVSTTSPTLTPFRDSDFLLFEEADAFLAILNSEPSPRLPNHEQSVPSFKNELKACEAKTIKCSVDEPPENMKQTEVEMEMTATIQEVAEEGSNCTAENQVKFATCTLHSVALTWWNTHVQTVGHEAAYGMSWKTLMKMTTDKYFPRNEIKKLERELWELKVKGTDLASYTQRFQELALLCGRMFAEEANKIEKYVRSKSIAAVWLEKVVTPVIVPAIKGFAAASAVLKLEHLKVDKHSVLGLESSCVLILAVDWEYLSSIAATSIRVTWARPIGMKGFAMWDWGYRVTWGVGGVNGTVPVRGSVRERAVGKMGILAGNSVGG
nr:reverse transcriptase domain-containing protein [Tanacetum cinerariifolium]